MRGMLLIVLIGGLLLAGCAPSDQLQRLERDLAEMKRRLAETEQGLVGVRKEVGGGAAQQEDFLALSKRQADLQADFEMFRGEFVSTGGQLDEIRAEQVRLREDLATLQQELAFKARSIEEKLAKLEQQPTATAPAQQKTAPEALYQKGLDAVRQGENFARARQLLDQFVQENPKHELVVNARYWIGEAWYGEGKFENAILQFQDVIQEYGDHSKVAAALLKQALAFQQLGDKTNSKVLLQRLVEKFPSSSQAKEAKKRLQDL